MMLQLGHSPVLTASHYAKIQIPVVVALGDQDKMIPLEEGISIFESTVNSSLDVLPYTQHPIGKVNSGLILSRLFFFDLGIHQTNKTSKSSSYTESVVFYTHFPACNDAEKSESKRMNRKNS